MEVWRKMFTMFTKLVTVFQESNEPVTNNDDDAFLYEISCGEMTYRRNNTIFNQKFKKYFLDQRLYNNCNLKLSLFEYFFYNYLDVDVVNVKKIKDFVLYSFYYNK